MKGGQNVECQGQIFGNVACRLENGSVECRLYILKPCGLSPRRIHRPYFFRAFEGKMSSVGLNFECRCRANFGLNVACRMKK